MVPWRLLDRAQVPGGRAGEELLLYQRGEEFSIRVGREELMNSRLYARTDALSELGCARVRDRKGARVLIGGLGMGYALATALDRLQADAEVVVAELVPAVVEWNRSLLGQLAGHPLRDPRVRVRVGDVAEVIAEHGGGYDAILLDVDNGPEGLTREQNDRLYGRAGLRAARAALRAEGVLGVWSSGARPAFVRALRSAGFEVEERTVSARAGRGVRHTVWLATVGRDA